MNKLLIGLLGAALISCDAFAQTNNRETKHEPEGPIVEMEPYVVKGSRILPPAEDWQYIQVPALVLMRGNRNIIVPGYEMLSNLTASQTKVLVDELQLRQFAAAYLWPMLTQALPKMPVYAVVDINQQLSRLRFSANTLDTWEGEAIVATDAEPAPSSFSSSNYSSSINARTFAAEYGLSQADDINADPFEIEQNETQELAELSKSYKKPVPDETIVKPLEDGYVELAVNGGPLAVLVRAGEPRAGTTRPSEERLAATISYQQNLYALKSLTQKPPYWFARGLSDLLGCTQVSHKQIQFALVRQNLARDMMAKLSDIFVATERFDREQSLLAAIFVHYGLYGDNSKYASRFMQFVNKLGHGEQPTETMFKQVFGRSMKTMERDLSTYARSFAAFKSTDITGNIPSLPKCTFREATQSEVARIKGEMFISQTNIAKALDELRIAYWRGEREPAMLALLATIEQQIGSEARARKILEALLKLPKPPPQTYIAAARLQLKNDLAENKKLSAEQTSSLIAMLSGALAGGLTTEDLCSTLAEIVLKGGPQPDANLDAFLREASKRYPLNKAITEASKQSATPND